MAQEIIDFGSYPNDPDSDAIRVAFQKTQNNFNELFSIQYQTGVSQVLEGAGITVNQNTGNVTVTNRIANITIQTDTNFLIGVTTASSNTATINSGTTPFVLNLANSISTGNITATGTLTGTFSNTSNSQPNITSIGNLGNLSVVGTIRSNSFVSNNVNALNFTATYMTSPGSNTQLLLNDSGNVGTSSNLTFNGNTLLVTGAISATGNIIGLNFINTGTVSAIGNITTNANITSNSNISATGNIIANNFIGRLANGTSNVSIPTANGNIRLGVSGVADVIVVTSAGAVINNSLNVSSTINTVDLIASGLVDAAGDIEAGGDLTVYGNANIVTNANIGNVFTSRVVATGNISGGNITISSALSATGNANVGNLGTGGLITATGNATAGNIITSGLITATGNVQAGNIRTVGSVSATGNLTANTANLGNSVTANFFIGNGNSLFSLQGANIIGNVPVSNLAYFSNITATSNANVINYIPFVNTTSGNANLVADSILTYNSNSKVLSSQALSITGNIVAGNLNVQNGTLTGRALSTGANTTQGNITGNWVLTAGSLLSATYADLAEYYAGDQNIDSGTVVEFGGINEIIICNTELSDKIAGVVSTNPAYVMNSMIEAEFPIAVALQGRVPVKVTGVIRKGDMLVSAGNGLAKSHKFPTIGSVIGKALQDFSGSYGVIEVAVGRL